MGPRTTLRLSILFKPRELLLDVPLSEKDQHHARSDQKLSIPGAPKNEIALLANENTERNVWLHKLAKLVPFLSQLDVQLCERLPPGLVTSIDSIKPADASVPYPGRSHQEQRSFSHSEGDEETSSNNQCVRSRCERSHVNTTCQKRSEEERWKLKLDIQKWKRDLVTVASKSILFVAMNIRTAKVYLMSLAARWLNNEQLREDLCLDYLYPSYAFVSNKYEIFVLVTFYILKRYTPPVLPPLGLYRSENELVLRRVLGDGDDILPSFRAFLQEYNFGRGPVNVRLDLKFVSSFKKYLCLVARREGFHSQDFEEFVPDPVTLMEHGEEKHDDGAQNENEDSIDPPAPL
ncbi:unnamed protein product [Nippostrongylus brasiliensis]|uniref:PH domain-containing protein n=1 Tax=Nippostrongylus brasiliensis TaxID=27835 RepID=A0A0N4Y9P6_NIPBR|nr:unnamed protein product [Nippostrongylus brasiliensis]